jgi:hypothetical protein
MKVDIGNAEHRFEDYKVDDTVFAYPSKAVLRGADLDYARHMQNP